MKTIIGIGLLLLPLLGFTQAQASADWRKQLSSGATLGVVRRLFLNQKVVMGDSVVNLGGKSVLLGWKVAHKSGKERYVGAMVSNLPAVYKGKTATVIAVQLNEIKLRELRPNALGEIVAQDDLADPYFDVVVRFDNGTLAMYSDYPKTFGFIGNVNLASDANALAEQISRQLSLLVGKSVYASGLSKLFKSETTLEEMVGVRSSLYELLPTDFPLLEPLTILAAKYVDPTGVILKVRFPDGRVALSFTAPIFYNQKPLSEQGLLGTLLLAVPKYLTTEEIEAVKNRTIYRGMSKEAVLFSMGPPQQENDWGRGGRQWIYNFNKFFVYINDGGTVADWQSLSEK